MRPRNRIQLLKMLAGIKTPKMGGTGRGPARPMSRRAQGSPSMAQGGSGGPGGGARKRAFKRRRKIHKPRRGLR